MTGDQRKSGGLTHGDLLALMSPLTPEAYRAMLLDAYCDHMNRTRPPARAVA